MRVTQRDLEILTARLNAATNSPKEYSTKDENGKFSSNIGHYTLSGAYGGWELQRVVNNGGAVEVISSGGHVPKRELYGQLCALVRFAEDN